MAGNPLCTKKPLLSGLIAKGTLMHSAKSRAMQNPRTSKTFGTANFLTEQINTAVYAFSCYFPAGVDAGDPGGASLQWGGSSTAMK